MCWSLTGFSLSREGFGVQVQLTRLGVEAALVRDGHPDVPADHDIERGVVERNVREVGDADRGRHRG
jgi:hypothetical protein